jgi:predicted dehydrogenase
MLTGPLPVPHPLRVVVCGAGAFGRNHIRVYRDLEASGFPVTLAAIVEPHPKRAATLSAETALPVFSSIDHCLAAIPLDAASVCVPTSAHFDAAASLLQAGLHLLIEKPITATLDQADHLIRLASQNNCLIQVGHLERFNPAVAALATRIQKPMFFEAHRLSIFSPRALDVDVVLDLMIHDLDIVLQLANSPVTQVHAVGLPILSSKVDIANARIEFQSGCVANFTASRVSTERVRKLRFFQPHQYVSVDYARQDLLLITVDPQSEPQAIPSPGPRLHFDKPPITPGEPLRLEIESFLNSILNGTEPLVPAIQARQALALALQVQSAIETHSQRAGLAALST